jgi:hypothetical protein
MLEVDFGTAVAAHSTGLAIVGVTASEHSTSASGIMIEETDTRGTTSAMVPAASSSVGVREAGSNIASRRLPMEWWFLLAILLHFLDLVLNHNSLIDHVLEIGIIGVEQLELNVIIQPIQEHVLLLLIRIDVIGGVSGQLDE